MNTIYLSIFVMVVAFFCPSLLAQNIFYSYPMNEFDSIDDARIASEFLAVNKGLKLKAESFLDISTIEGVTQQILLHSYPYMTKPNYQRLAKCDESAIGLCVNTEVFLDFDNDERFRDHLLNVIGVANKYTLLIGGRFYQDRANFEKQGLPVGAVLVKTVSRGVEQFMADVLSEKRIAVNVTESRKPLYEDGIYADEHTVIAAKNRAVTILKHIQSAVEPASFTSKIEDLDGFVKTTVNMTVDENAFVNGLISNQVLAQSAGYPATRKKCGPIFSDLFFGSLRESVNLSGNKPLNSRDNDAAFYQSNPDFGIYAYDFSASKGTMLVTTKKYNTWYLGLCDADAYENPKSARWRDGNPWHFNGTKLLCNTSKFDCELLGALWLLEGMSVSVVVNNNEICSVVAVNDWYNMNNPVNGSHYNKRGVSRVTSEVRLPSIRLNFNSCSLFEKGLFKGGDVKTEVAYYIPNRNWF
jgi:hypothetical protein